MFTKYGFITAVNARTGDGNRNNPTDPDKIIIRTRVLSHMENLKEAYSDLLGEFEIDDDTHSQRDYRYITIVPKAVWVEVIARLALEMDYPKFKPSVVDFDGKEEYQEKCLEVWHTMYDSQL